MDILSWIVVMGLGAALLVFSTYAAIVGGVGALVGARFDRCPRCGGHGLAIGGRLHGYGCPHGAEWHFGVHPMQGFHQALHLRNR